MRGSSVIAKGLRVRVSPSDSIIRGVAVEGASQHTRDRRPHCRHSSWPWEGHIGSVCINWHHRLAIRVWVGVIDGHPLPWRDWHTILSAFPA